MKIVKSANLIGSLNRLVFPSNLIDSQPLDSNSVEINGRRCVYTRGWNDRYIAQVTPVVNFMLGDILLITFQLCRKL